MPSSAWKKKYATNFPPFSLRLPFQLSRVYLRPSVLRCWRALLLTLCVLPFCNPFPHTYIRRFHTCTYFLSAISFRIRTYGDSTYVHTPKPHSILRFRPAPQTPDLRTSNLPRVNIWCTTQLAKLSFNHSHDSTHSWRFSTFYKKYCTWYPGTWYQVNGTWYTRVLLNSSWAKRGRLWNVIRTSLWQRSRLKPASDSTHWKRESGHGWNWLRRVKLKTTYYVYTTYIYLIKLKNVSCEYNRLPWMIETQPCKLCGTSDAFIYVVSIGGTNYNAASLWEQSYFDVRGLNFLVTRIWQYYRRWKETDFPAI